MSTACTRHVVVLCIGVLGVLAACRRRRRGRRTSRPSRRATASRRADRLYACGICHFNWTGTGARNPFGTAVEQQLYLGKSIDQALQDVEGGDTDGDGFTNVDELLTFMTLPGTRAPTSSTRSMRRSGYDTYITPMVASCLEPLDIRVSPSSISVIANANDTVTATVTVFNNGSQFPLNDRELRRCSRAPTRRSASAVPRRRCRFRSTPVSRCR